MLSTCSQCGAPLERTGHEVVVCRYCEAPNVPDHVQPQVVIFQQVTEIHREQHLAAPIPLEPAERAERVESAKSAKSRGGAVAGVLFVGVLFVVIGGAMSWLVARTETRSSSAVSTAPLVTPASPARSQASKPVSYFDEPGQLAATITDKFGASARAKSIVLYDDYFSCEMQDDKRTDELDRYFYHRSRGAFDAPRPVSFRGTAKDLTRATFAVSDVDFSKVPGLCRDAIDRLALPNARVSHVYLDKNGRDPKFIFRVYVGSERRSGYAEYESTGKVVMVSK